MKEYRVPFFCLLEKELSEQNVELIVAYGRPDVTTSADDDVSLPCSSGRPVREWKLFGKLSLLNAFKEIRSADLVVVEHANKNLINYLLYFFSLARLKRVANWSHGYNRQAKGNSFGERFKRLTLHWSDWWFAYTKGGKSYLVEQGYPTNQITVVQNSIDTSSLKRQMDSFTDQDLFNLRRQMGWSEDSKVAVYCGSLYPAKRIDLLLAACLFVNANLTDFRLLIVGGGKEAETIKRFSAENPWCVYIGPKFGAEKAQYLKLADVFLNPGVVGLSILDAFCAGLPFITCEIDGHGPEIEYLEDGVNGYFTKADAQSFSMRVLRLLKDPEENLRLRVGALNSASRFSIDSMVKNFSSGIKAALLSK